MIKLGNGDCLRIMKGISDNSVDMVLTDPPYGMVSYGGKCFIPLDPLWKELKRVMKQTGVAVLFGSQPFTAVLICSNLDMFKYSWVWKKNIKTNWLNSRRMPLRGHEDISVFCKGVTKYNPQKTNSVNPNTVLEIRCVNNANKSHPAQQPVELLEYLMKTYTDDGDLVLDFAMGSGSVGVACLNINRNFIGIELDKDYFEVAKRRIKERQSYV